MKEENIGYRRCKVRIVLEDTGIVKEGRISIPKDLVEEEKRLKTVLPIKNNSVKRQPIALMLEEIIDKFSKSGININELPDEKSFLHTRRYYITSNKEIIEFINNNCEPNSEAQIAKVLRWYINTHNI